MNSKPNAFACVFYAVLGLIGFFVLYMLAYFIIALAIGVLSSIPLVGFIISWIFEYDFCLCIAATLPAIIIISTIISRTIQSESESSLTHKIIGVSLMGLQIVFAIINIASGNSWAANVAIFITGFRFYVLGSD